MNIVGIIAEYNPMHNGHVFNISKAREITNADYVIVIMSGSFTEQGNVCTINKFDRAKMAIQNGADLVIELPTIYATKSSEAFAKGAVSILNSLGVVTHLAFGAETSDIASLKKVAQIYLDNQIEIVNCIKEKMKSGISSSKAYSEVFNDYILNKEEIFKPNNILGIEYIKALIALKSNITPVLIKRIKSNHNDNLIGKNGVFASSTSIRNALSNISCKNKNDVLKDIKKYLPLNTYNYLKDFGFNTQEDLWKVLKYEILRLSINGLKNIYEVDEGLEKRLYEKCLIANSYEDYIFKVKTKRYTLSRIKRICINIILNITKEKYDKLSLVEYARILKIKSDTTSLLSIISKNSTIPIITKVTNSNLETLDSRVKESVLLDIFSHNIANSNGLNKDYSNKIKEP